MYVSLLPFTSPDAPLSLNPLDVKSKIVAFAELVASAALLFAFKYSLTSLSVSLAASKICQSATFVCFFTNKNLGLNPVYINGPRPSSPAALPVYVPIFE